MKTEATIQHTPCNLCTTPVECKESQCAARAKGDWPRYGEIRITASEQAAQEIARAAPTTKLS